jgi:hypothetical protein
MKTKSHFINRHCCPADGIMVGLGVALLLALTGCVGYVGPGYGGDVEVGVPGPDVVLFGGGGYDRGRDVHDYSNRGAASRAVAHGGGGRGGGGGGKR